jgi:hypothetical protein
MRAWIARINDGLSGMPADGISLPPKKGDFGTSRWAGSKLRLHQPRDWAEGGMTACGTTRTSGDVRLESARRSTADIDQAALHHLGLESENKDASACVLLNRPQERRIFVQRTISSAPRLSRSLCRTPDEADAEDEHADGQQHCADIGKRDEPVRARGIGREHG